jgi:very-short-patch-repair endonuclease
MPYQPYQRPAPSHIEVAFWDAAKPLIPELETEIEIGHYRVDFLVRSKKIIIELEGHDWHSTKAQRTRDTKRERYLQQQGYQVLRFTGTEIFKDVNACVEEVVTYLSRLPANVTQVTHTVIVMPSPKTGEAKGIARVPPTDDPVTSPERPQFRVSKLKPWQVVTLAALVLLILLLVSAGVVWVAVDWLMVSLQTPPVFH